MILHLGNDLVVYEKDIILIIDSGCYEARVNSEFWDNVQVAPGALSAGDKAKSFVLVAEEGGCVVYPSPISSQTLVKRAETSDIG